MTKFANVLSDYQKVPEIAPYVTEIWSPEPIQFNDLFSTEEDEDGNFPFLFPNLRKIKTPKLFFPYGQLDVFLGLSLEEWPTLFIPEQYATRGKNVLSDTFLDVVRRIRQRATVFVAKEGLYTLTIVRTTTKTALKSLYPLSETRRVLEALKYPWAQEVEVFQGLDIFSSSTWTIGKKINELAVSLQPDLPVQATLRELAAFQERLDIKVVKIVELGQYIDFEEHLDEFLKTLSVFPFEYGFYPSNPSAEERELYLEVSCLPYAYRIEIDEETRDELINMFENSDYWHRYRDVEAASEADPYIFDLAFKYGPEACYSSGLAKTRMSKMVRGGIREEIEQEEEYEYIPVIRYSETAEGSLFFQPVGGKSYCGTFYYHEPESEILLRYQRKLETGNKFQAADILAAELIALQKEDPKNEEISTLRSGLITAFQTIFRKIRTFEKLCVEEDCFGELEKLLSGKPLTPGILTIDADYRDVKTGEYDSTFYAVEDPFDQPLCQAGKYLGYDVLVFLRMPGSSRLVPEVLDVRSREESLENLFRTE